MQSKLLDRPTLLPNGRSLKLIDLPAVQAVARSDEDSSETDRLVIRLWIESRLCVLGVYPVFALCRWCRLSLRRCSRKFVPASHLVGRTGPVVVTAVPWTDLIRTPGWGAIVPPSKNSNSTPVAPWNTS